MCMLVPGVLKPAIKLLAQAFPDSSMQKATAATSTVYDACSHLIEVCYVSLVQFACTYRCKSSYF